MSEYNFGDSTKRRLSDTEVITRDRICRNYGGNGYTQTRQPGQGWMGWFSAPNRGEPFDGQLAARVMAAVRIAEGTADTEDIAYTHYRDRVAADRM